MNYRNLNGRKRIYSNVTEITEDNVLDVLGESLGTHKINAEQIKFLYNYYKGCQPVFNRSKEVRSDIKNLVMRNIAYEIVEFKKGYRIYNRKQLYFGPYLLKEKDALFKEKCQEELKKIYTFYPHIPKRNYHHRIKTYWKIKMLKKILWV